VISAIHGTDGKIGTRTKSGYNSLWRDIVFEMEAIKDKGADLFSFMHKRLGDGVDTYFWKDTWNGELAFKLTYPRLYALEVDKNISVADKLAQATLAGTFRREPRSGIEAVQLVKLEDQLEDVQLVNKRDRLIKAVLIKVNILAWKVRLNCLPSRVNISRRGIDINSILCPICERDVESVSHIFFSCYVAKDNFKKVCRWWIMDFAEVSSYDEWLLWISSLRIHGKHKKVLKGVSYGLWWHLWFFRNKWMFGQDRPSMGRLFDDVVLRTFYWIRYRYDNPSANNSVFRSFFEKQKLTGPNFIDWYQQLKIVLSIEDKLNYLEQLIPPALVVPAGQHVAPEILAAHTAWIKGSKEIDGLMLITIEADIQQNLETLHAHEMLLKLKTLFTQQAEQELLQTTRDFHSCKQEADHGIIAHRTPPYTPQHNGVSERRNRTLLDMVRSMMSQTTLLKSFWDYALETVARILNMVPTKKVKKTSYEVYEDTTCPDRMCLYIDAEEHELGDLGEPANYKVALLDPESKKWLNAMNVKMQSMKDNKIWVLGELPPNGKVVGSKWLFKKKTDMDGVVHTYKARLVAKGYTQTSGIDYEETFSSVADIRAIRILIAIAAYYDYKIWQIDVKTTFLNGYLNEAVYMEQPEGFVNQKYPKWVCKLKRSIYGLKQTSRQRNTRFDNEIKKFGFTQNRDEPCVYLKASGSNITFLILYVDDILIMGNNIPMLQSVKSYLGRCFAMKYLGEAAYIFGIKIYKDRSRRLIGLCQSAYIKKILKQYCMENSKRESIPMQEKLKLSKSQGASTPAELKRMQNVPYASAVRSIMYAVRCTRLDVAFAQNVTSRFQQNPGDLHWTTVKNILKYLRNTKNMFLVYECDLKRELRVSCYTDAGYLTDADDLKKFIFGLGVVPTIKEPISMYCDNTGVIAIANESEITKGATHFRAKVHYLREVIEYGDIKLEKVHTDDNLVDPFTKALAFPNHSEHTRNIGMLPASSLM
nr:hypothetical protein [Tanacetum cinerariifolium]